MKVQQWSKPYINGVYSKGQQVGNMKTMRIDYNQWSAYLRQYSLHYLVIILSGLLGAYVELMLAPRTGSLRFHKEDPAINKSYVKDEMVSTPECVAMSAVLALLVITGYCSAGKKYLNKIGAAPWMGGRPEGFSKEWHLLHLSIICQMLALSITCALTCALKLIIGNTRPDFLARCQLKNSDADTQGFLPFYTIKNCQQKDLSILYEGLKSTPSGHSSLVSCGLGFLYLWQCRFIKGSSKKHAWCPLLALLVMVSRVVDHKHHWYDLIFGGVLGYVILRFAWRSVFDNGAPAMLLPAPVSYP